VAWDTVKSLNFEFLRGKRQELAALCAFAEQYAHPDPSSALVKLRTCAEQVVLGIYQDLGLPRPVQADLVGLLNNDAFRAVVPRVVLDKRRASLLRRLRRTGFQTALLAENKK